MRLLSVIIPVYNTMQYLSQCIESLQAQTYTNLEIMLVDDGSTDGSGELCDKYAEKDKRIRVIHQQNGGPGLARNVALDMCHGDYITMVDADDCVLPETFATSIEILEEHNLDAVHFNFFQSGVGGSGNGDVSLSLEAEHDKRLANCFVNEGAIVGWGYVFCRDVWKGVRFPVGRAYEDVAVAYLLIDRIYRLGHIEKAFYYYREVAQSRSKTAPKDLQSRYDFILASAERLDFAQERNFYVPECRSLLLKAILSYLTLFYGIGAAQDEQYMHACELLRTNRELEYVPSLMNGKYRMFLWCFERFDFVHRISGRISVYSKKIKSLYHK